MLPTPSVAFFISNSFNSLYANPQDQYYIPFSCSFGNNEGQSCSLNMEFHNTPFEDSLGEEDFYQRETRT